MVTRIACWALLSVWTVASVGCDSGTEDSSASAEGVSESLEAVEEPVGLSIDEVKALNEELQCQPGEVVCDAKSVVQCTSTGAPEVLKSCAGGQTCVEGECAAIPACTKQTCEYEGAYCPDSYPPCPYGIQIGDTVENAELMDPVTKSPFNIGQHYGEEGVLVLVSANGW